MNKTFDKIGEWTNSLTDRLTEMRFWDVEESKTSLKVHLALAMKDCLTIQISETKRKLNQAKILIANCGGQNQQKYTADLIKLKEQYQEEIATLRQIEPIIRKDEKFRILSRLVGERFGFEILEELKRATKTEMNVIVECGNKPTENAYQRGVRETKERLKSEFEKQNLKVALTILENTGV